MKSGRGAKIWIVAARMNAGAAQPASPNRQQAGDLGTPMKAAKRGLPAWSHGNGGISYKNVDVGEKSGNNRRLRLKKRKFLPSKNGVSGSRRGRRAQD